MASNIAFLGISLIFILIVCSVFTNAIEWLGKEMNLGQGVTGSILAAVGTALPETIIPIIAIVFGKIGEGDQIGIGAIAGAPFMLCTLGFFITGFSVVVYSIIKKRNYRITADINIFKRDLMFFIIGYGIAILTTFLREYYFIKQVIPLILLSLYLSYIIFTFSMGSDNNSELRIEEFYLTRLFGVKRSLFWIFVELAAALAGLVYGSELFVFNIEAVSEYYGIAPLVLSILITPIATELPEKFNSVIWIGKGKDTLALGNITGAMVFQSCIPAAFGIMMTSWKLNDITLFSAALALISGIVNLVWAKTKKSVNPLLLISGGALYIIFLLYLFLS